MAILRLLERAGIEHIIPLIKTIDGQSSCLVDDFTIRVYPFAEGKDGFSRALTNKQWHILAKTLRQVHEMDIPVEIQEQLRRESYSPKWREALRLIYAYIETEACHEEIALKLSLFMKEKKPLIHHLLDRAEQLAQKLQSQSPKFALCHSDIHGGNVLIDKNKCTLHSRLG